MDYEKLINQTVELGSRGDIEPLRDALALCREYERKDAVVVYGVDGNTGESDVIFDEGNFAHAHALVKKVRAAANKLVRDGCGEDFLELYYATHLFDALYVFDSYCLYLEKDREARKQFYLPRRKQLLPIAEALQDLEDGKLYLLGISQPPGTGKTTLAEFFLSWTSGKHPELANLVGSHSNTFLDGMYGEMLRIFDPQGDYRWADVFPGLRVINTRARERMIDIGASRKQAKRFATVEFGSIGAQLAGRLRAQNLLYCDDLIDGIETAMSMDRLDKLWQQYHTDLRQRKIGDRCKELHICTRWSVHDIVGRLEREYEGDPHVRFLAFPALNEDDESNFNYPFGLGYTTADLRKQRDLMDSVSFAALFMNQPIEREGQLYEESELRRFFELPDVEPDNIIAFCDTKEQGKDFCVMPIVYQYGKDYYIDKFICDNGKVEMLEEKVARALVDNKVKNCRIESNRGGTLFAQNVQQRLKELGGTTNITTKWTQTNKETRIQANSGTAKSILLFKDASLYPKDKEYRLAMTQLCSYSMMGKNRNDDVPDAIAMLVDYVREQAYTKVSIMKRLF